MIGGGAQLMDIFNTQSVSPADTLASPARREPDLRSRGICAVTGASGYVGSRIASRLTGVGWEVRALCRSSPGTQDAHFTHVPFELAEGPTHATLEGVDTLVHAAYDFSHSDWSDIARVNIEGSRRLLAAAREAGVARIVCVSTVAAFPGARSMYGRAKLEIERVAIDAGATIVRPGLVWGPQGAAMFGALRRAVERLPVVPLLAPASLGLTLVYEDDLTLLVERLLEDWPEQSGGIFVAASEQMLTYADLLRSLAPRAAKGPRFVAVPWRVVWLALSALERVGVKPPFRSDSLLGLVSADSDPLARATASAERYGVSFRPYSRP
jgi:nucleoside-diphosphate-sugar epimerase